MAQDNLLIRKNTQSSQDPKDSARKSIQRPLLKAKDTISKHTTSVHSHADAAKLTAGKNGMIKAKDIEKKFLIQMKEMEKMVKDCKIECTEHLSKNQL